MVEVIKYDPDIKRLRTFIDRTDGIQLYTRNNMYPQTVEAIRDRSYTCQSAVKELANFIAGEGFEGAIGDLVVNAKGQTLNDILNFIKVDAATFSGSFVIHLSVNMLGQYNGISVWPLSYFRFGLPDENGDVHEIAYNSNWEQDAYKEITNHKEIVFYPKFDPNPEQIKEAIEENGMIYPGQVFYCSPLEDQYPLATFDSVLDQSQTQEEIGIFRLSSIQNGLNAGYIFSYPGKFEDDTKARNFKESLNEFKGGKGANSVIVIEDESGTKKAADLITPTTIQNVDKIHEFISRDDKESIIEAFGMPKIILGVQPESGMFNKAEIQDAYVYFNTKTRPLRQNISRCFKKIFKNWETKIESDFKIKELVYFEAPAAMATPAGQPAQGQPEANTNKMLTNLTGKQFQGIQRIVRQYNKEQLTFEAAANLLRNGFALSESDINDFLITKDEELG